MAAGGKRVNVAARVCCGFLVVALSGCDWVVNRLLIGDSPECDRPPRVESLTNEVAIVRVNASGAALTRDLYLDRLSYLAVPDSIRSRNRVVIAQIATSPEVLAMEWGDTVRVTTTFAGVRRAGGYEFQIPDWAANEFQCFDGALAAVHRIVSIAPYSASGPAGWVAGP